MASTNHTPNLNLNQWEANDPVIREDFNADNAKIDAAVGIRPVIHLGRGTLTEAGQFDIDVSAVDWSAFASLELNAYMPTVSSTHAVYTTLNHSENSIYYRISFGAEAEMSSGSLGSLWASHLRLNFLLGADGIGCVCQMLSGNGSFSDLTYLIKTADLPGGKVNSIQIFGFYGHPLDLPAGSWYTLTGTLR